MKATYFTAAEDKSDPLGTLLPHSSNLLLFLLFAESTKNFPSRHPLEIVVLVLGRLKKSWDEDIDNDK